MKTEELTAERKLRAVAADGGEFEIHLAIGKPYSISSEEWACPVWLDGLHDNLHGPHGVDSWQALQLAYALIAQLLGYFIQDGGRLYWPEDGGPVLLQELMPKVPAC
ncbi:MAG TPA: hypothetical protein VFJ01_08745 [Oleiagrimonas sp.]|nr:hypothetical protein [Oleiagrimonas sp.]